MLGMVDKSENYSHWQSANWLHGRLNVDHSISKGVRFRMDIRTQVFYSTDAENLDAYADGFGSRDESVNLHAIWWKGRRSLGQTNVERLVLSHRTDRTTVYVGRQRIHWGMSTIWNPNDVFQAGNPFDPDYVERPGVDAIRIQRATGSLSGLDLAIARMGSGRSRGACRYYSNRNGFDWQVIAGWYEKRPIYGVGWSGDLGNYSFRGEAQSFIRGAEEPGQFQCVVEWDRLLRNNNYAGLSILYNEKGVIGPTITPILLLPQARQLMPGKWNVRLGWQREASLRFRYGIDLFYTSAAHTLIFFPKAQVLLSKNWQIEILSQWIKPLTGNDRSARVFIRIGMDLSCDH